MVKSASRAKAELMDWSQRTDRLIDAELAAYRRQLAARPPAASLVCPRCRLRLTPRLAALTPRHCPRCLAQKRLTVELETAESVERQRSPEPAAARSALMLGRWRRRTDTSRETSELERLIQERIYGERRAVKRPSGPLKPPGVKPPARADEPKRDMSYQTLAGRWRAT